LAYGHRLRSSNFPKVDRLEFALGEEAQVDYGEGALTKVDACGLI